MDKIALVVGATGITGSNLSKELIAEGFTTFGLARNPQKDIENLFPIAANLLDTESLKAALESLSPTHVYFTTWMRNDTEAENIRVNSLMVRNLLDVLSAKKSVQHVALVTGLKHYLGPFEAYAKEGFLPQTPLREEQPRLDLENFYYAQEDEVYAAAKRDGFTWSVHRPHTVIGKAVGNLMNLGTTLAAYATICKETGRPFRFPGSSAQWNGISDVTDARILAKQLVWASTTDAAKNEAFNVVNGDYFRWSWLWNKIAAYFGVEAVGYDGSIHTLENEMANDAPIWKQIAEKYNLKEANLNRLASAWHTDLDLGRPIEVMTDMAKSRKLGFNEFQSTEDSFYDLFKQLRKEQLIP
ncbi:SDR family oxidoreductase [Flavobacterium sp. DG1-102-2]|uniref:SDR family oxidoreductase n=1 Tax=Flavobacterium sp. DG1-102-2 TaxID=3081663 RepID=UPI002949B3B6|nr:SDR family oxidoreductase [Flavobacterium sp. DG1-102-2]MDV6166915.1 SDR family oxidoreductase [Flavobacterium sp. DG1-102-2]